MSNVIAIANQKGGVGKTTTALNLGASLAAAEKRTLLIDLDPQGNLSSGLGVSAAAQTTAGSLYGTLLELRPLGSAILRGVHLRQLDVVPTTQDLVGAETELSALPHREFRMRRALDGLREMYDYILIDCPPNMGLLTLNALIAADAVLIPVQAEFFALEGMSQFAEVVELLRRKLNPRLQIAGVLLTMFDGRLRLAQQVAAEVESHFGPRTFRTRIPRNVRLAEAPGFGQPAILYDAASAGAQAYLALAGEIIRSSPRPEWRGTDRMAS